VTFALLVLAGIGAGLTGSIAGLASLISYPALLAAGLSPVSANVTNSVALVFNSIGSVSASRPELVGQRARLRRLVPISVLGGITGGLLVLLTPSHAFARVVPVFIGLSSIAVLVQRRPTTLRAHHEEQAPDARWLVPAAFGIGVYGGYFGAAAGVLLLAVLLFATGETLARSNGAKNVVLGAANAVAALAFVLFGHIAWLSALPLAIGCLIGGRLGPAVVRRAPARLLRIVIAIAGIGLAVYLGVDAYG
jgi:uncharacterized membrane protein YfcA